MGIFAFFSVTLSVIAFLPYICDTFRRSTQPDRATWLIWAVLSTAAFSSMLFEGAGQALWFVGAQAGMTLFIFVQSIWLGAGSYFSRINLGIFAAAMFALVVWYVMETSVYTLMIVIFISALGAIPTIRKAARAPHSETASSWIISGVAALCGVASVGSFSFFEQVYPSYLALLSVSILWAMWVGHQVQPKAQRWSTQELVPVPLPDTPVFASVRHKQTLPAAPRRAEATMPYAQMSDAERRMR